MLVGKAGISSTCLWPKNSLLDCVVVLVEVVALALALALAFELEFEVELELALAFAFAFAFAFALPLPFALPFALVLVLAMTVPTEAVELAAERVEAVEPMVCESKSVLRLLRFCVSTRLISRILPCELNACAAWESSCAGVRLLELVPLSAAPGLGAGIGPESFYRENHDKQAKFRTGKKKE